MSVQRNTFGTWTGVEDEVQKQTEQLLQDFLDSITFVWEIGTNFLVAPVYHFGASQLIILSVVMSSV